MKFGRFQNKNVQQDMTIYFRLIRTQQNIAFIFLCLFQVYQSDWHNEIRA